MRTNAIVNRRRRNLALVAMTTLALLVVASAAKTANAGGFALSINTSRGSIGIGIGDSGPTVGVEPYPGRPGYPGHPQGGVIPAPNPGRPWYPDRPQGGMIPGGPNHPQGGMIPGRPNHPQGGMGPGRPNRPQGGMSPGPIQPRRDQFAGDRRPGQPTPPIVRGADPYRGRPNDARDVRYGGPLRGRVI